MNSSDLLKAIKQIELLTYSDSSNDLDVSKFSGIFDKFYKNMYEEPEKPVNNNVDLKSGFYLVPLEFAGNTNHYSQLYRNGKKISNMIFRQGGMCHGFRDGFCDLIFYNRKGRNKFDFGTFVIIDEKANIVLKADNTLHYPYHNKGVIASLNNDYYNLLTGEIIINGSTTIDSENYLFVENKYNDKYIKGVYKIEYMTGLYEIIQ